MVCYVQMCIYFTVETETYSQNYMHGYQLTHDLDFKLYFQATLSSLENSATQMRRAKEGLHSIREAMFGPQVLGGLKWADSVLNISVQVGLVELEHRELYMNAVVSTSRYFIEYIITYVS